jgi:hypothetical protein
MIAFDRGPRFESGRIIVTADAAQKIPAEDIETALKRHLRGDWGDLGEDDRRRNDETLEREGHSLRYLRLRTERNSTS